MPLLKIITLSICCLIILVPNANAQRKKKKNKVTNPITNVVAPSNSTSINEKIKRCKKIDGLFQLYRDTSTGSLLMLVNEKQFNKEYIYFSYVENGNTTTGHNKGTFRGNKIFTISKYFNQIEFTIQNTNFYFNPENEIHKSAHSNITNALMATEKIIAFDSKKGDYLIEADNIFLTEALYQIKQGMSIPNPLSFGLGNLSKTKTRYYNIKNYPENTDIIVKYVYDDPNSRGTGSSAITDGRFIEIYMQHSIIEMPKNNFKPRFDDPRIGYFLTQTNDMTTTNHINYRDMIHRWHLEKKNPELAISEPIKPITWWIENTTPKALRPIIKDAILKWNQAFEKAGFKNAVQIFEQPDTCDWDAGDIRYNVLRWTSSPEPPFGGYGPSFVNPRTGEILGADIMLEWVFITNRLKSQATFEKNGIELSEVDHNGHNLCLAGNNLNHQNLLGLTHLSSLNADDASKNELIKQSLHYLILHEVGHTLGLNHNMIASQLHSLNDLYNNEKTETIGLIGSVMDYPAVNFSNRKGLTPLYYTTKPGPYDLWAIEFGYFEEKDVEKEKKRLENILARSTEKELAFGNDADDMRSPGKAIDPRVMIGDLSNDAIGFAKERVLLIKDILNNLLKNYPKENKSYDLLRNDFLVLTGEWGVQAGVVSRYIGGIYIDRSFSNQITLNKPYQPVPLEVQKSAMKWLNDYLFSPKSIEIPSELIPFLQQQRRGFGFFSSSEDPKIHDRIINIQKSVLQHILHQNTLKRITDSRLYGNEYHLSDMLKDLSQSIFNEDLSSNVNTFRQNSQILYIQSLINVVKSPLYDNISKSKCSAQLQNIQKTLQPTLATANSDTKEHRNYLLLLIKNSFENK
ncbi:MAG: zinc-dependent metalloprotease [Bacteroidota bacterium]|nr:zinc-dependent metalloprotease [Bacteroidota bacterium]